MMRERDVVRERRWGRMVEEWVMVRESDGDGEGER